MGYDNAYIERYANFAIQVTKDSFRNEVYYTMINIVRSRNEKLNGGTR